MSSDTTSVILSPSNNTSTQPNIINLQLPTVAYLQNQEICLANLYSRITVGSISQQILLTMPVLTYGLMGQLML